jgi:hypothetical protein
MIFSNFKPLIILSKINLIYYMHKETLFKIEGLKNQQSNT